MSLVASLMAQAALLCEAAAARHVALGYEAFSKSVWLGPCVAIHPRADFLEARMDGLISASTWGVLGFS